MLMDGGGVAFRWVATLRREVCNHAWRLVGSLLLSGQQNAQYVLMLGVVRHSLPPTAEWNTSFRHQGFRKSQSLTRRVWPRAIPTGWLRATDRPERPLPPGPPCGAPAVAPAAPPHRAQGPQSPLGLPLPYVMGQVDIDLPGMVPLLSDPTPRIGWLPFGWSRDSGTGHRRTLNFFWGQG